MQSPDNREPTDLDSQMLRGVVIDEKDAPVGDAEVRLLPGGQTTRTDPTGSFSFLLDSSATPKRYQLFARRGNQAAITTVPSDQVADRIVIRTTTATWPHLRDVFVVWFVSLLAFHALRRVRVFAGALLLLLVVLWLLADGFAVPVPYVADFLSRANLRVFHPELNAHSTVDFLPSRVGSSQRITVRTKSSENPIKVDSICTVDAGGELTIHGPVSFLVAPNAGIVSHGQLHVRGEADAVVSFAPSDTASGWENISLLGDGASGSSLAHCVFSGGTGATYLVPRVNMSMTPESYTRPPLTPATEGAQEAAARQLGGALLIDGADRVTVNACIFKENTANLGGAAAYFSTTGTKVVGTLFLDNMAQGTKRSAGGAVYCANAHELTFRSTHFIGNKAVDKWSCGGAAYLGFHCNLAFVEECLFEENETSYVGGAIYAQSLLAKFQTTVLNVGPAYFVARETTFRNNMAHYSDLDLTTGGAEIFVDNGYAATLNSSVIRNMQAQEPIIVCQGSDDQGDTNRASVHVTDCKVTTVAMPYLFAGELASSKEDNVDVSVAPLDR